MSKLLDCLVIGGGPAGLTAAIYLARFRLSVLVIDAGGGRASLIPCTRNQAGFPDGVSGHELLARMRDHAQRAGAQVMSARVERLTRGADGMVAHTARGAFTARAVLLATGVTNHRPSMSDQMHAAALAAGRWRYCPVCDGFEVIDQNVAVIGTGAHAVKEALFLRAYTRRITLVAARGEHILTSAEAAQLAAAGIVVAGGALCGISLQSNGLSILTRDGEMLFDTAYPAMGSTAHSDLAKNLGADLTPDGCIKVDQRQRTSTPDLYAAGDVVAGLDQISHAMGEAGVAATTIRNDLAALSPLQR